MPEITIDVEIYCGTCGAGLCSQSTTRTSRFGQRGIDVEACQACLEKAKSAGYDEGYEAGYARAEERAAKP